MRIKGTGVAYVNTARGSTNIKVFQDWPGRITENKVPTTVVYDVQNPGLGPTAWGFLADTESERPGRKLEEWFKTELDKPAGAEKSRIKPADELYRDFLAMVYDRLGTFFTPQQLNGRAWDDARVEFVFSVPATWDTAVVDRFKAVARAAGFGARHAHSVTASLTEPQAVAGFTVAEEAMFENGESVLVIDIGGGTVDLCLVSIDDKSGGVVSVTELKPVMGDEVFFSVVHQRGLCHGPGQAVVTSVVQETTQLLTADKPKPP